MPVVLRIHREEEVSSKGIKIRITDF